MTTTTLIDLIGTALWTVTAINVTVITVIVARDRREERLSREQRTRMWAKMEDWDSVKDTTNESFMEVTVNDNLDASGEDWSYLSDNEDKKEDTDDTSKRA